MTCACAAVLPLPSRQRAVVTLCAVEGMTAAETCEVLQITEVNRRVVLHHGREGVRRDLDELFAGCPNRRE